MNVASGLAAAALLGLTISPLSAGSSAPPPLLNKTVTMTWTTSGHARCGDGYDKGYSNTNNRVVYISTAGRPFLRAQLSGGGRSRTGEVGPGEAAGKANIRFEGNRLIGVETFAAGARQFTATFDASFASCTLSIVDGRGAGGISRRGPGGAMCKIEGAANTGAQCSIQTGNAFAGR